MTLVIDTTILVDHLRGVSTATKLVREAFRGQPTRPAASVMTKVELLAGMRSHQRHVALALIAAIDWVPVYEAIADRAGQLARRYRSSHPGVDLVDYVIAATVEALDAELWTSNTKHFPMFPGLHAPY